MSPSDEQPPRSEATVSLRARSSRRAGAPRAPARQERPDLPPWDPTAVTLTQQLPPASVRLYARSKEEDERLALFAAAADRERAEVLLEGLVESSRDRAVRHLRTVCASPSSERQGLLARAFGVRPDAAEAVRALWEEAGPPLRRELYLRLPPWLRSLFPSYDPGPAPEDAAPGLGAFAERLLREATR